MTWRLARIKVFVGPKHSITLGGQKTRLNSHYCNLYASFPWLLICVDHFSFGKCTLLFSFKSALKLKIQKASKTYFVIIMFFFQLMFHFYTGPSWTSFPTLPTSSTWRTSCNSTRETRDSGPESKSFPSTMFSVRYVSLASVLALRGGV